MRRFAYVNWTFMLRNMNPIISQRIVTIPAALATADVTIVVSRQRCGGRCGFRNRDQGGAVASSARIAAARNSVQCTALIGVTRGSITGSAYVGGDSVQAAWTSLSAARSSVRWTALIGVCPGTMVRSVHTALGRPQRARSTSTSCRISATWIARTTVSPGVRSASVKRVRSSRSVTVAVVRWNEWKASSRG